MSSFQVAVVGAGIAGLTAAYKVAAEGLAVVHFVDPHALPGGLVANVGELHGIPWARALSGMDFANQLGGAGALMGVQVVARRLDSVARDDGRFQLVAGDRSWACDQVILATGASLRDIQIPGAQEFKNNGVLNCAWCNGGLFRRRPVVVIGGGNSALQEAMHLAMYASSVTIVTHADRFHASRHQVRAAARLANVQFRWDTEALEIIGAKAVQGLRVRHKPSARDEVIQADGVFVFIGLSANADLVRGFAPTDEAGCVVTNEQLETSCPGLFAIGGVRSGYNGEIISAMGEATAAALTAAERARY
jgi:thioredoxin reductase (NADPH)